MKDRAFLYPENKSVSETNLFSAFNKSYKKLRVADNNPGDISSMCFRNGQKGIESLTPSEMF